MEMQRLICHAMLIGALLLAIAAAGLTTSGRLDPTMPLRQELPRHLEEFRGVAVLHCQNPHCRQAHTQEETIAPPTCPACGAAAEPVSLAERNLLPEDTQITRRVYVAPSGHRLHASIVVGGHERRSIHKPQVCLVAQGNTITRQYPLQIEMKGRQPLDVMLMEMNASDMLFAYWFTDGKRETASHLSRLLSIAWDGVVHSERRRWAYVAVSMTGESTADSIDELKDFLRTLYAAVTTTGPPTGTRRPLVPDQGHMTRGTCRRRPQ